MKIEQKNTFVINMQHDHKENAEEKTNIKENRKGFFAGNWNSQGSIQDRIAEKKERAKAQAMKLVKDAFSGDHVIDQDLEDRRQHIKELRAESLEDQKQLQMVDERRNTLSKAYENGELSQESYEEELKNLREEETSLQRSIASNDNEIMSESAVIKGTKIERLKNSPMLKAQKQSEVVLESASEEIKSMLVEEAQEQIDSESKEREEKAKELKEERKKQEEFIEKQKEKHDEQEELFSDVENSKMLSLDKKQTEVKQEVENMLSKMKLLEEDLKGAAVDESM